MMNIYRYELKANWKSTFQWLMVFLVLGYAIMAIYPSYAANQEVVVQMLQGFSEELLFAMGINVKQFFTVSGFYGFLFLYLNLMAGIQASLLVIGMFSKEQRSNASAFLFTKPTTRMSIALAKLLACLSLLMLSAFGYGLGSMLILRNYTLVPQELIFALYLALSMAITQIWFAGVGCLIAALWRIKSVVNTSMVLVFTIYLLGMMDAWLDHKFISPISPFLLIDVSTMQVDSPFSFASCLVLLLVPSVSLALAFVVYCKKDILR